MLRKLAQKAKHSAPSLPWVVGVLILCALVCLPLYFILHETRQPSTEAWEQLSQRDPGGILSELGLEEEIPVHSRLFLKTRTTLYLLLSVGLSSTLLGTSLAWLVSRWSFPLSRLCSVALVLPLTIPSYILATSYKLITLDLKNAIAVKMTERFGGEAMIQFDGIWNFCLATGVLTAAFFPYIFIAARTSFSNLSSSYLESASSLGHSPTKIFYRIALPLARPAIVGGLMLVCLETLNEFGAMKILGIDTLTTEIFYAWVNLEDKNAAVRLSGVIMLILFALLLGEQWLRGGKRFHASRNKSLHPPLQKLSGPRGIFATALCIGVFGATFALPVYELVTLALAALKNDNLARFAPLIGHSLQLAGKASLFILSASLFLAYACRLVPRWWMHTLSKISTLGYAIPGAILGICTISAVSYAQSLSLSHSLIDYLFYGSSYGLIIGYLIRFLAVGMPPLDAGLKAIHPHLDEAGTSLRHSRLSILFRVHLPLLRLSLAAGLVMLFIDILKELPLTLILNPANHETLATKTYSLFAVEERYTTGAIPALILIAAGILGIASIHLLTRKTSSSHV